MTGTDRTSTVFKTDKNEVIKRATVEGGQCVFVDGIGPLHQIVTPFLRLKTTILRIYGIPRFWGRGLVQRSHSIFLRLHRFFFLRY